LSLYAYELILGQNCVAGDVLFSNSMTTF